MRLLEKTQHTYRRDTDRTEIKPLEQCNQPVPFILSPQRTKGRL